MVQSARNLVLVDEMLVSKFGWRSHDCGSRRIIHSTNLELQQNFQPQSDIVDGKPHCKGPAGPEMYKRVRRHRTPNNHSDSLSNSLAGGR